MRIRHRTLALAAVIAAGLTAAILLAANASGTPDGPPHSHPLAATAVEYALL